VRCPSCDRSVVSRPPRRASAPSRSCGGCPPRGFFSFFLSPLATPPGPVAKTVDKFSSSRIWDPSPVQRDTPAPSSARGSCERERRRHRQHLRMWALSTCPSHGRSPSWFCIVSSASMHDMCVCSNTEEGGHAAGGSLSVERVDWRTTGTTGALASPAWERDGMGGARAGRSRLQAWTSGCTSQERAIIRRAVDCSLLVGCGWGSIISCRVLPCSRQSPSPSPFSPSLTSLLFPRHVTSTHRVEGGMGMQVPCANVWSWCAAWSP
jgi:hypothetical protein